MSYKGRITVEYPFSNLNYRYLIFNTLHDRRNVRVYIDSATKSSLEKYPLKLRYELDVDDVSTLEKNPFPSVADYRANDLSKLKMIFPSLFVFDLDGTLVNSNPTLRHKVDISDSDYDVGLIPGVFSILEYLQQQNPDGEFLMITNRPKYYVKKILCHNSQLLKFFKEEKIFCQANNKKIRILGDYCKKSGISGESVIAFGDDEKDALIYSDLGFNFLITDKHNGYPGGVEYLRKYLVDCDEVKKSFRYNSLYEFRNVCTIVKNSKSPNFMSYFMDDLIVYFKRFYKTRPMETAAGRISYGLIDSTYWQKKSDYMRSNSKDYVAKDFSDLNPNDNVVFAKVPGSAETKYDSKNAVSILLQELIEQYGDKHNYSALLLRKNVVDSSHVSNSRTIQKHLDSIEVNVEQYGVDCLNGKVVYLFDDISTSGSSLLACSELLYQKGAAHVVCFALAKTGPNDGYNVDVLPYTGYCRSD